MKTLDRTRDYGSIGGDSQGRVFEQDETFFCADGTEWGIPRAAPSETPQEASQADLQTEVVEEDVAPKKKGKR